MSVRLMGLHSVRVSDCLVYCELSVATGKWVFQFQLSV